VKLNILMTIDRPMSRYSFKIMTLILWLRDIFNPPHRMLGQLDSIKSGAYVLDYGSGPGSYSIAASELVGHTGKVYAVDIHPVAVREVQNKANEKGIPNLEALLTNCNLEIPDSSIDVVLLIYVLHDFKNPPSILSELGRVLKHDGILVAKDQKLQNDKVISIVTSTNFKLIKKLQQENKKKSVLVFGKC
jgi:ubiquinone/menaquinone biosynthesis C-methylase UbiE